MKKPVFRLPCELFCQIFHRVVHDYVHLIPNPVAERQGRLRPLVYNNSPADPTILAQVCSSWREVAVAFRPLWCTTFIKHPSKYHVHRTHLWLERSNGFPLSLTLISQGNINATWKIMTMLLERSRVWREIDFRLPNAVIPAFSEACQIADTCEMLRSVRYRSQIEEEYDYFASENGGDMHELDGVKFVARTLEEIKPYFDDIWSFFYSSPKLLHVAWEWCYNGNVFPRNTPFRDLASVQIGFGLAVNTMLDVLACLPKLKVFSGKVLQENASLPPQVSLHQPYCLPLTLRRLRSLELKSGTRAVASLMEGLMLPALTDLLLVYDQEEDESQPSEDAESIQQLLQRSQCRLEALSITHHKMKDEEALRYITIPELGYLSWLCLVGTFSKEIVAALSAKNPDGSPVLLPHLTLLSLHRIYGIEDGLLATLLRSRQPTLTKCSLMTDSRYGPLDDAYMMAHMELWIWEPHSHVLGLSVVCVRKVQNWLGGFRADRDKD
ncbi:unnamed protein product [Cyclocybe aegerita]|uniref:F-box domain-containing protein n=1 Tax=Cyclocybe aegerita TaxID=1973307 RepID=A0A8S0X338_CYCAE|nr:unnamed protein product [Cyclocybe aegerita]